MMQNTTIHFNDQKFYIGIDVHKKNWVVTIRCNSLLLKRFSMNPSPLELKNYLQHHYPDGTYYSVYEAGFSGFWIHRELTQLGIKNIVINPADVPTTHKEKTNKDDKVDSRKLARELENNNLKEIYVPDEFHQELRSLCRLRHKIISNRTRIKNRIKMYLHYNGIKIPPRSECSHWSKRFVQWLKTVQFTHSPAKDYLDLCIEELENERKMLIKVTRQLRKYCQNPEIATIIRLLLTVPGIGFIAAVTIYTELIKIVRFKKFDHLCSYVGLAPSITGSGDKSYENGITQRRNRLLRYILIEAAWIAIRKDPALLLKYNELTKRIKAQDAIVRIAKKLLNRIRYVWLHETPYVCSVIK